MPDDHTESDHDDNLHSPFPTPFTYLMRVGGHSRRWMFAGVSCPLHGFEQTLGVGMRVDAYRADLQYFHDD